MKISAKILAVLTAFVFSFVSSSNCIKNVVDELTVYAASVARTGDVNDDGEIDILDLIYSKSGIIENRKLSLESSDVNTDGVFSTNDVYEVEDYLIGRTQKFTGDLKQAFKNIDRTIVNTDNSDSNLQMTAEMASLAQSLKTPLEIYKYVLNNVNTEFYYGSRKGAIGTYEQNGGNDYDQSSLLIAMLRYMGYEANYAKVSAAFSEGDLYNLTASMEFESAIRIFTSSGKTLFDNKDGTYTTEEIIVLLNLDGRNYYLDPFFKYHTPNENAITLEELAETLDLAGDSYDFLNKNEPNASITDVFPAIQIVDQGLTELPKMAFYALASNTYTTFTTIPKENNDIIELSLGKDVLFSFTSSYLYDKDLTVEYELTEDALFELNDVYGFGIDSIDDLTGNLGTYAGFAQIYGVIKLDGKKIANGNPGFLGEKEKLTITVKHAASENSKTFEKELIRGALYSIVLDYQMISPHDIAESYSKLPQDVSSQKLLNENNIYGSTQLMNMMSLLGKTYFSQIDTNSEGIAQLSNIYYDRSISVAVVEVVPDIKTQNGSSNVLNKQFKMIIDFIGDDIKLISREGDLQVEKSLYHSIGLMSSFYESEIIREFSGQRAVSTEEILQIADEQDIDILFLSKANLSELDSSGLSAQNKTDIQKYIEEGYYITVPAEEVTVDSWTGAGYIAYDPISEKSIYIINTNLHGGAMVSWVGLSYLCDMIFTVVECTWSFDMIMLGATVLGAGIILFSGPIGVALLVSAIGVGLIAAGGFYLKSIGDRFCDATMLMDDYINGDIDAGVKLKTNSLWHGASVGLLKAGCKYFSKETTAPFFKLWIESELGYNASRAFENTIIGNDGALEILAKISSKYGNALKVLIYQFGESIVNDVAESYVAMSEYEFQEYIYNMCIEDVNILEIHNKNIATDPLHSGNGALKGNYTNGSSAGLKAQDDAVRILLENGYDVEILPEIDGGNTFGIQKEANPDFLINNKVVFDCYAPELQKGVDYTTETKKIDSFTNKVCKQIGIKTKKQASRIVLNLRDIPEYLYEPMYGRIIGKTAKGQDLQYLDELIVILNGEKIERWFLR
ncbi:MAG: hypothetical protein IJL67_14090 [Oscillospiraceae bacterium]|nr:hypothetical protein [Oscillospiraceae bacterium]